MKTMPTSTTKTCTFVPVWKKVDDGHMIWRQKEHALVINPPSPNTPHTPHPSSQKSASHSTYSNLSLPTSPS
eukprot:10062111-Ditylum_brightwellii.AAC.1